MIQFTKNELCTIMNMCGFRLEKETSRCIFFMNQHYHDSRYSIFKNDKRLKFKSWNEVLKFVDSDWFCIHEFPDLSKTVSNDNSDIFSKLDAVRYFRGRCSYDGECTAELI